MRVQYIFLMKEKLYRNPKDMTQSLIIFLLFALDCVLAFKGPKKKKKTTKEHNPSPSNAHGTIRKEK